MNQTEREYQAAIAQLQEEKRFKETLLGISEAVAAIKDRKELFDTIVKSIKPVFPFDDIGVFVYDETRQYQRDLAVNEQFGIFLDYHVEGWLARDPGIGHFIEKGPLIKPLDSLIQEYPGHPHYAKPKKEGLTQILGGPMKQGGEAIGMLCFWSKQKGFYTEKDFPLFQAISEQLSIAVSNVLAKEAIQQRNLEKSVQIALINSLNEETDWQSRQKKFAYVLGQVFPTDFIAFHYAKEGMYEIDAGFEKIGTDGYRAVTLMDFLSKADLTLKDFEKGLKEEEDQLPFILETAEKAKAGQYLNPVRKKSLELLELKSVLAVSMQVNNAPFYIYINSKKLNTYHRKHIEIFERIAPSFAQSLEKSLANEDIQKREREKALQVAVINALNEGKTWEDRLLLVARALQDIIPFHLVSFGMMGKRMDDINFGFEQIGTNEYRTISIASFLKMSGLKESTFKSQVQAKSYDKVTAVTSGDFVKSAKAHPIIREMHRVFGINSLMVSPLVINDESFYISFYHKDSKAYRNHHISFLERVQPSFILALEKLLAYEQIVHLSNQLQQEKDYLQEEVNITYDFANMVGQTSAMQQVFQQVRQVAASDTTVMVLGETGTGKELIARALHDASPRKDKPLVKLNCAALPESLIESELFGHERGAFTGALKKRTGKFELAHKSTIFLDEIGELPLAIQAKLLRVIQEKEFEPLGSNKTIRSDFRLIAATNRNLVAEVQKGNFRQDLFYRLNAFPIILPPLRTRVTDIPLLLDHYGNLFAKKLGYPYLGITEASLKKLQSYDWPGNIRELQNLLEQALLTQGAKKLTLTPQPDPLSFTGVSSISASSLADLEIPENELEDITLKDIDQRKSEVERAYLEAVLQKTKWRISGRHGAAALLDVKAPTLESRLKKLGIRR